LCYDAQLDSSDIGSLSEYETCTLETKESSDEDNQGELLQNYGCEHGRGRGHYLNQYAIHCGNDRWTKLIVREFEVWLGLTITMRIHKLLTLEFYWSNEWVFAVPQFKTLMTRFHYQIIKSHLYFSNPDETHMY
jgi:hypothetical protein